MTPPRTCLPTIFVATLATLVTTGCEDARVARMATEAADRQAAQNVELARVAEHAAAGDKQLTAPVAVARRATVRDLSPLFDSRRPLAHDAPAL